MKRLGWIFVILIVTGGCGKLGCGNPTCDILSSDHDALYRRGDELIQPYLILSDRASSRSSAKEADVRTGIACLENALAVRPSNWSALWLRGKGFQALGEHLHAVESLRSAYLIEQTNPDVGRELMVELIEIQKFDEAVVIAEAVVRASPDNAGLKANLALALVLDRQLPRARLMIADALRADPSDAISEALARRIEEISDGRRPQPHTFAELQR